MSAPDQCPLEFACVCASNVNRSMAAHQVLDRNTFKVHSYGTNSHISIPGPSRANNYDFGTTYSEIIEDLKTQEQTLNTTYYTDHALIEMMERDATIKEKPERFSTIFSSTTNENRFFDVIFTYQKAIMDRVVAEFHNNGNIHFHLCHIINIETPDDNQNAMISAGYTLKISRELKKLPDLTEGIEKILNSETLKGLPIAHHIVSY